jgi:hypothetical protein
MKRNIIISEPNILIVEGDEDKLFFEALIEHLRLPKIQVMSIGGKTQIRRNLKTLTISSGFSMVRFLQIIRDADEDPPAAFQSVRDALQAANLPVPDSPVVVAGRQPSVAVMILPDESTQGALEDLCLQAVAPDPAIACVKQYFLCLEQQGLQLPKNVSKAKVHAFLASRAEADKRLGEAAQAGYWPWNSNAFDQLKNFLQQFTLL